MCSGKRAEDSLYQNVMGDDRPLFNEFSFHSKAIPVTPADAVLTKANLLLHTKVVDSSPATSLCHIPVGAGGVKISCLQTVEREPSNRGRGREKADLPGKPLNSTLLPRMNQVLRHMVPCSNVIRTRPSQSQPLISGLNTVLRVP